MRERRTRDRLTSASTHPLLARSNWTEAEDRFILESQARMGNKWSQIAKVTGLRETYPLVTTRELKPNNSVQRRTTLHTLTALPPTAHGRPHGQSRQNPLLRPRAHASAQPPERESKGKQTIGVTIIKCTVSTENNAKQDHKMRK